MTTTPKIMIEALQGRPTQRIPVWFMRQAGRYLPEYRALREKAGSFLGLAFNPDYAAEVTLQPLRRFDLDAAILFSDILVIPHGLGQELTFVEGEGPRLGRLDIDRLNIKAVPQALEPVFETLRRLKKELPPEKTLIGFAGAPWTVACYMVDGQGTRTFDATRAFAAKDPQSFQRLMDILVTATTDYLSRQIDNGADTVQIFDSWAGLLAHDRDLFTRYIIEPTAKIVAALKTRHPHIPIIGFPRAAGRLYGLYAEKTGVDGIGLDPAADFSAVPAGYCVQGNLDPEILLAGGAGLEKETRRIISSAGARPFIFNLGHGIIKETPIENVETLIAAIRKAENS